jgi:hypothetical protein
MFNVKAGGTVHTGPTALLNVQFNLWEVAKLIHRSVSSTLSGALNTRFRQISEYSEMAWSIKWIVERFASKVARCNG